MPKNFANFQEFYPFYLEEHRNPRCRLMHFIGSTLVLLSLLQAIISANLWWLAVMPLSGYGFAWLGHFVFEGNRPATFRYPLYSLIGDWVMYRDMLIGRVSF
jgi:hypothetical protein